MTRVVHRRQPQTIRLAHLGAIDPNQPPHRRDGPNFRGLENRAVEQQRAGSFQIAVRLREMGRFEALQFDGRALRVGVGAEIDEGLDRSSVAAESSPGRSIF